MDNLSTSANLDSRSLVCSSIHARHHGWFTDMRVEIAMKMQLATILAATAGLACTTLGQVHKPKMYVWGAGGHPYEGTSAYVNTPDLKAMIRPWNSVTRTGGDDPVVLAREAADEVYRLVNSGGYNYLDPNDITLSFWSFGRNDADCDVGQPFESSPIRFFREADRIGSDSSFGFPEAGGRTYRNPVKLSNARDGAPLRQWFIDFCTEYKLIQDDEDHDFWDTHDWEQGLPPPSRFYMDNETHESIGQSISDNDLWMLHELAASDGHSTLDYWGGAAFTIPGTGKTLKQLYAEKYEEIDNPLLWPESILDPTYGIQTDFGGGDSAESDLNRPFMLWYAEVCRTARNEAMKRCFYDVVPTFWSTCKVLNYEDGRADGVLDTTGWYIDSDGTKAGTAYPTREPSKYLVRGRQSSFSKLAGKYWDEPTGETWDVYSTINATTISSPVLYKMGNKNFFLDWCGNGYGTYSSTCAGSVVGAPVNCAQQPNVYLSRSLGSDAVLETRDETSIRFHRHMMESFINSGTGENQNDVVPWVALAHDVRTTPKYLRSVLGMTRSHDIQEIVGFTGKNVENNDDRPLTVKGWKETQAILDQVYASWVSDYDVLDGDEAPDVGETTITMDPSKLEYVLRDNGHPRQVVIESEVLALEGGRNRSTTTLDVEFSGLYDTVSGKKYPSVYPASPVAGDTAYAYAVTLECQLEAGVLKNNAFGTVQVYDWLTQDWIQIYINDSVQDEFAHFDESNQLVLDDPRYAGGHFYTFNTDDRSVRITFDVIPACSRANSPVRSFVSTGAEPGSPPAGKMRLRLTHQANDSTEFTSKYDLVQVAPYPFSQWNGTGSLPLGVVLEVEGTEDRQYVDYDYIQLAPAEYLYSARFVDSLVEDCGEQFDVGVAYLLKNKSTPPHSDEEGNEWFYEDDHILDSETGLWLPAGYDAAAETAASRNTRLVSSWFNKDPLNPTAPTRQWAVARFSLPVWTDAPDTSPLAVQPYTVWYWLYVNEVWQEWQNVTAGMQVEISRDPDDRINTVVVRCASNAAFQAGYYALVLNTVPPSESGDPYAVYSGGTFTTPGPAVIANRPTDGVLQYNFRIYPDCDGGGVIDDYDARCDTACDADVDNGSFTGEPDNNVDINDLLYFLACFEGGAAHANLDDGSGTGTPDSGVDISDLLYFLAQFELGC